MKHEWLVTPKEAVEIQKKVRESVRLAPFAKPVRYIAGCDVSLNLYAKDVYAGFIVLSYPDLVVVDHAVVKDATEFPYVPGLLSFREIPALMKAWEKLKTKPDLIMVDGQGIAHPRRLGIASHLGVVLDMPTIGVAKSLLTGVYDDPIETAGAFSYLKDRYNKEEIIGAVLRTKNKVKPLFISPGHKITLLQSIDFVKECIRKHRLPEPTRLAHEVANEYRKKDL